VNLLDIFILAFLPISFLLLLAVNRYKLRKAQEVSDASPAREPADQATVDLEPLRPRYLFLDLETTGLDPNIHRPIEVAAILTDKHLREITRYEAIMKITPEEAEGMSEWCRKTHGESGLTEACLNATQSAEEAFSALSEILDSYGAKNLVLGGNSIHFDRSFLKVHALGLMERLHYRNFDVTTVLGLLEGTANEIPRSSVVLHRAMADIEWSLETARKARSIVGG